MIHSTDDNRVEGFEYLPVSTITPQLGRALKQTDGLLAAASGTDVPTYICMCEIPAQPSGTIIPVIRVAHDVIYETEFSAAASSIKIGDKVTIAADGLRVTATTTNGVAEVVYMEGTAVGSKVRVRF